MKALNCGYECHDPVIRYPDNLHTNLKGVAVSFKQVDTGDEFACRVHNSTSSDSKPQKCFRTKYNESLVEADDPTTFTLDKV